MGIISSASGSSCWRGLDYYKENKIKYINRMSKKELVEELTYILDYAPEWVYDDFIKRNDIEG